MYMHFSTLKYFLVTITKREKDQNKAVSRVEAKMNAVAEIWKDSGSQRKSHGEEGSNYKEWYSMEECNMLHVHLCAYSILL